MKERLARLQYWLRLALIAIPIAYVINFIYAVCTGQAGGTFGDTFGAANALFSGVALMMLIYAVILQREELSIVQQERNDTKRLLDGQEKLNTSQQYALNRQIFEQSFYSLIRLSQEEKQRLMGNSPHWQKTELRLAASFAEDAILNGGKIPNNEPETKREFERRLDAAHHYTSLLIAVCTLIRDADLLPDVKEFYRLIIFGLMDSHTGACVAWFVASTQGKEELYVFAYNYLNTPYYLSPATRQAMREILEI